MSDFAMGGVLLMKYEDKKWRSVAYISKSLNKAECQAWFTPGWKSAG